MGPVVEAFDSPTRDTPARAGVPRIVEDNPLFTRYHRAYYLQNRTNMYITWDYRRAREGAENYRGGMVWHEGKITFKRDATLAGGVPVMLFYFTGGAAEGTPTTVLLDDADAGPLALEVPRGQPLRRAGRVAPGGYVTVAPCDLYNIFYAAGDTDFRYALLSNPDTGQVNQLQIGLGEPGQKVTAGTELRYRFAVATLGGPPQDIDAYAAQAQDIAAAFGIGGGERGVQTEVTVGELLGREMFLHLSAAGHEAQFTVAPRETIVDLPIRLDGIQDNGCAAVYTNARPWFRWVGVAEGSASRKASHRRPRGGVDASTGSREADSRRTRRR